MHRARPHHIPVQCSCCKLIFTHHGSHFYAAKAASKPRTFRPLASTRLPPSRPSQLSTRQALPGNDADSPDFDDLLLNPELYEELGLDPEDARQETEAAIELDPESTQLSLDGDEAVAVGLTDQDEEDVWGEPVRAEYICYSCH